MACVLKAPAFECRSILSIDTLDRHPDRYSVDTRLQQPVDSRPSVDRLICIDRKLVDSRPTVDRDVDQVLTEVSMKCRLNIDRMSIESIDRDSTYLCTSDVTIFQKKKLNTSCTAEKVSSIDSIVKGAVTFGILRY